MNTSTVELVTNEKKKIAKLRNEPLRAFITYNERKGGENPCSCR